MDRIDTETVQALFEQGAMFVLADVPLNTEFGIDYNCWRTGENFKGVKMIPPGLHYIYYSTTDKYGSVGLRNGFFYNFKLNEIVYKKWDKENECIDMMFTQSDEDVERIKANKFNIERFLGAYPYDQYKKWVALSNCLNEEMVMKLLPDTGIITCESTLIGEQFKSSRTSPSGKPVTELHTEAPTSLQDAENRLPKMTEEQATRIKFTQIPAKNVYPVGASAAQITIYSIDQTLKFQQLLPVYNQSPDNVLCELQFSFICFLIGHVADAFEQWKQLVNLICNCESLITKQPQFYLNFLNTIYFQLKEMPTDFFIDLLSKENFLIICLHNLIDNINSVDVAMEMNTNGCELKEKCKKFQTFLSEYFQFDFNTEPDEYAPTIVDA